MGENDIKQLVTQAFNYIYDTFHAKMGSIKDRNGMDLTEAEASLGNSKTCRAGHWEGQAEKSWASADSAVHRWIFFLAEGTSVQLLGSGPPKKLKIFSLKYTDSRC